MAGTDDPLLDVARRAGVAATEAELRALPEADRAVLERVAALARARREAETIAPPSLGSSAPLGDRSPREERPILGRLGRYLLLEEIGRGGMGIVYRAHDPTLDRTCAVKVLLPDGAAGTGTLDRFAREARVVARLGRHPHIVPVFELGQEPPAATGEPPRPYIAMELVEGRPLDRALADGPLAPRAAAELGRCVASALAHAHRHGLIHRDVKPSNILLDARSAPHVTDFGLAKEIDTAAAFSLERTLVGTPAYMPPEQAGAGGPVDARSDVYSLGATLYHCICGRPPFSGPTIAATVAALLAGDPVPPRRLRRKIPRDLETIVLRALEKDPARRYASAEDMEDDLRRFLEGEPIRTARTGPLGHLARRARRHPRQAALVAAALAAVLSGAALLAKAAASRAALERRTAAEVILAQAHPGVSVPTRIQIATAALEQDPTCYHAALLRGRLRLQQALALRRRGREEARGPGELALADLTRAIELRDDLAIAYFERAIAREIVLGEPPAQYEPDYRRAAELGQAGAIPHLIAGNLAARSGRTGEAKRRFEAATEADPTAAAAWIRLGMLRGDDGDEPGAFAALERGLALDPAAYDGLLARGRLKLRQGDAAAARADGDRAVRLGLRDPQAYVLRSNASRFLGHAVEALADADTALEIAPDYPDARLNRACALALLGRLEEASADLADLERRGAVPRDALFVRAYVHALRSDRRQALLDLDGALKEALRAEPLIVRASLRLAEGDLAGAADDTEAAIRLAPGWGYAYTFRGLLRAALFDLPGAALDHDRAAALSPDDPRVWEERGELRRALGNRAGALDDLGHAIAADPYRARGLVLRGTILLLAGDLEGATRDFQAALIREPESREALLAVARVAARRGDQVAARTYVRRALSVSLPALPEDVRAIPELAMFVDGGDAAR